MLDAGALDPGCELTADLLGKPRAGIGTAVPRWNYGDLRAAGCGLGRGRGDCVKGAAA